MTETCKLCQPKLDLEEALDELEDVLMQATYSEDNHYDSGFLSSYASAFRLLAKHGRFIIKEEAGRFVRGQFVHKQDVTP